MKLFLLVLRLLLGGLFFGHGMQKLKGWFGGHGLEGTGAFFESLGMRPGRQHALAAGASEAGGGVLLALGLATPAAAAGITGVMTTAIRTVQPADRHVVAALKDLHALDQRADEGATVTWVGW
jgi:putative oxidoreductase